MQKQSQPNRHLPKEEVNALIKQFQSTQDEQAQEKLVINYRDLVEMLARKYSKGKMFHEDITQVGIIGLIGAIHRYDESFGKSFEAFAVPTVIGEIKRFLRDKTWSVHVPRRIKELGPKIKKTVEQLTTDLQRSPKVNEIADYLEVSEEEVLEAMEMGRSYQALSVDHSIEADSEGGTVTLLDIVGDVDQGFERVNQKLVLEKVLHVLTEREKSIIQYTYLDNLSQKEAGEKLGISQMHVSRLQRRAIKKLQEAIQAESSNSEFIL
ncbi:RNA polymerase sigma factor SigB [Cytobacillus oceanisediminis]|jgi:RNA polymerase sigma-B factor|uniref:RNA polymerase sigma factor SigB n=2 Tax=Niallia TaxID=2837506 RepID=A0A941JMA6_NIACI|nr:MULTISPECIES: RNA polymerase sigma factor SigB [Bacillaceae]EOR26217.1 RNA polymerase sigma factor SigB [Niallia nealsonii AAU1]MBQ6446697.1 RNA polymerase sigma factor SigB [Bacillus sp. (in: firmicutes)]MDU1844663.1 RNA polymerase sigma factor SigB [Niallia nealsonii]MBZ9534834.1 RNA polymerase sigma factor SigB [Cytobacillus oceanisediminis]MCB5238164.1 RNA polymerase sigma factor SigB [Niallia circulans]